MTRPTSFLCSALLAPCLLLGCATAPAEHDVLAIGAVQGREARSMLVGRDVGVEGIVTATVPGGWFLQDEGDGDDATSDALFVQEAGGDVRPGERLRVHGTVAEIDAARGSRTALVQPRVQRLGDGAVVARAIDDAPADWESLEGMRVRIEAPLALIDGNDLPRHDRVQVVFGERPWQPSERAEPGSEALRAIAADNTRRTLLLEGTSWPEGVARARAGSRFQGVVGVVDPDAKATALRLDTVPELHPAQRPAPPVVAGNLRIAALNLENLFNGDGRGGGFPTPRGARTAQELQTQLSRHVAVIDGLNADVVALMELENDGYGPQSSIASLVVALDAAGATWQFVDAGKGPGENAIRVGLIYRADRVRPVGKPAMLEGGPFGPESRVPLAQAFVPLKAGKPRGPAFVVVANHFKSKGCSNAGGDDRDQRDGAGCYDATRTDSARRLDAWLATDPTGHGARTLIVGDLNAYAQERPVRTLREAGWRDAFEAAGVERPYSYVYDGLLGRLDHALLSPAFVQHLRGAAEWHVNADEPDAAGYRAGGAGPWRSSDHDPLVLGFDL